MTPWSLLQNQMPFIWFISMTFFFSALIAMVTAILQRTNYDFHSDHYSVALAAYSANSQFWSILARLTNWRQVCKSQLCKFYWWHSVTNIKTIKYVYSLATSFTISAGATLISGRKKCKQPYFSVIEIWVILSLIGIPLSASEMNSYHDRNSRSVICQKPKYTYLLNLAIFRKTGALKNFYG